MKDKKINPAGQLDRERGMGRRWALNFLKNFFTLLSEING